MCYSPLGGTSVAAIRAVALLAAGATGAEGDVCHVLFTSVCAGSGIRVPLAADPSHHAAGIAAACALVAMRPSADSGKLLFIN